MQKTSHFMLLLGFLLFSGCKSKAQAAFERGQELEKAGNLPGAVAAYKEAAKEDPGGEVGREGTAKADLLRVQIETKAKAATAEAERKVAFEARQKLVKATVAFYVMTPQSGDELEEYPTYCTKQKKPSTYVSCRPADDPRKAPDQPMCGELASFLGCEPAHPGGRGLPVQFCCPKGVARPDWK